MVRIWSQSKVLEHPWERVSSAAWLKYPHDTAPHVQQVDVVNRTVTPEGHLRSTRLIQCIGTAVPGVIRKVIGDAMFDFAEESVIKPKERTHTSISRNMTLCNLMEVEEVINYTPDPLDSTKTMYSQEIKVKAFPYGLRDVLETHSVERSAKNSQKGFTLLNSICDKLKDCGDSFQTYAQAKTVAEAPPADA